jgi:hypothetical protein
MDPKKKKSIKQKKPAKEPAAAKKKPSKEPVPPTKKKPAKEPAPPKKKSGGSWPTITLLKQQDTTTTDHSYDKRLNTIVKRIRSENTFTDDKLRFGWNTGDK